MSPSLRSSTPRCPSGPISPRIVSPIALLRLLGLSLALAFGGHAVAAGLEVPASSVVDLENGGLDLACGTLNVVGQFKVQSGQLTTVGGVSLNGGTLDGGSGLITNGGDWANNGTFIAGTGTVALDGACAAPVTPVRVTGDSVFHDLTLRSTTGGTFVVPSGEHITVLGTLTLQGQPGLPLHLVASSGQTAVITLGPGAQVLRSNADVADNVRIGAAASTGVASVPTMNPAGMIILALLLFASQLWQRSKRP